MAKQKNQIVLVISDLHIPYHHPDTLAFLREVKASYKPDRIVCVGDEIDSHAISYHESDPDLASAGDELTAAIEYLQPLYKLFPRVDLIDSNHGSLHKRKGRTAGLSQRHLKDYGDVLEAPQGWTWHNDLTIKLSDGQDVYFHHGLSANILKVVREYSINVIQGHYHNSASIQYASTPEKLLWGMQVGCSINDKSLAFAYNKTTLGRPIISHGIIIDGQPHLLPMVLNKRGRWNGFVP